MMSDIIESIKQGAEQVISGIDQKGQIKSAIDGVRRQWTELERKRRVSQVEGQVKSLQTEMKQLTEALGLQTLSLFDSKKIVHPELTRLCERINELRAEVEQKKAELTELQVQAPPKPARVQCPRCNSRVSTDDGFCPKCGERLQQPVEEQQTPQTRTVVRLRCPKCKTILTEDAEFCPGCGVKIKRPQAAAPAPAPDQFCASCGAQIAANARFCPVCGQAASG
jgi:RNA polymerase subunit RPABC4/transcription elongation factor Spt4